MLLADVIVEGETITREPPFRFWVGDHRYILRLLLVMLAGDALVRKKNSDCLFRATAYLNAVIVRSSHCGSARALMCYLVRINQLFPTTATIRFNYLWFAVGLMFSLSLLKILLKTLETSTKIDTVALSSQVKRIHKNHAQVVFTRNYFGLQSSSVPHAQILGVFFKQNLFEDSNLFFPETFWAFARNCFETCCYLSFSDIFWPNLLNFFGHFKNEFGQWSKKNKQTE